MSLPAPHLDDRKFQDIVDDAKRQIGLRCPEWTDHNVSDPGVTLIELFAWMMEGTLYRLNQVPERNYIKFLELLGITLESAAPARTDLCFRLSRPIFDTQDDDAYMIRLPAFNTVAATMRTEIDDAIDFTTEADLVMVRPRLSYIFTGSQPSADGNPLAVTEARPFEPVEPGTEIELDEKGAPRTVQRSGAPIFSPVPREGDALYLGFEADISGNLIELRAVCNRSAATGLDEDYPAQLWEFWNVAENRWDRLVSPTGADTTCGFNRTGAVELLIPRGMLTSTINNQQARWIRCRYTTAVQDLPPRGPNNLRPSGYRKSPEVFSLEACTVGGSAPASNANTVTNEVLGQSDGTPGQVFKLAHAPLLPRRAGESILIGELGAAPVEMEEWTEVSDFSESGPHDRHFVCDGFTGEIFFGPNIHQPDGSTWQYGAVPAKGLTITFSAYRFGGGVQGNIREHQVRTLKSAIPYIADVWNPVPATGGQNQEVLERAKMRARASLRIRERAVTAEDYEFLACRATSSVGRAQCVQPGPRHSRGKKGELIPPGVVRVLLVPALGRQLTVPRPSDLRIDGRTLQDVFDYLDQRRMLTTVLEVGEPEYVFVSTEITLVADPKMDADQVALQVKERLEAYTHPLWGGPNGDGWPFRRALTLADVYAQVGAVPGVAFLLDAKIFTSRVDNPQSGRFTAEKQVSNAEGVRLSEHELLCTREHRIHVRPIWTVGMETPSSAKE
ncbi:MAG: putative baseplate assembly protein [Armatimonadota bacterium]